MGSPVPVVCWDPCPLVVVNSPVPACCPCQLCLPPHPAFRLCHYSPTCTPTPTPAFTALLLCLVACRWIPTPTLCCVPALMPAQDSLVFANTLCALPALPHPPACFPLLPWVVCLVGGGGATALCSTPPHTLGTGAFLPRCLVPAWAGACMWNVSLQSPNQPQPPACTSGQVGKVVCALLWPCPVVPVPALTHPNPPNPGACGAPCPRWVGCLGG